jgi:hypothetical protein
MRLLIAVFLFSALLASADPQRQSFESGPGRVALVELYTSEGCSSCPPAERWLGALRNDQRLWREFVPMAFHVNYWDRLGWKDRLSSPAFTQREYAYSAEWGSSSVYTPCFVLNGTEWHADPAALSVHRSEDAGRLLVELTSGPLPVEVEVRYAGPGTAAALGGPHAQRVGGNPLHSLVAHVALLGGGISTQVKAGENSGATLTHEFAVLSLGTAAISDGKAWVRLGPPLIGAAPRRALAAWITAEGSARPIQAVGGWLDDVSVFGGLGS